ncbi:MAG: restriction endonuclease [Ruminococcus sp.]|nr:restriction endonuclease [Ruminococcus sp.]
MVTDINPYRKLDANISPTDFEIFCLNTLKAYADREGLKDFSIKHNQKIQADDGTYQIDVIAEYTALGARHKVIVECKKKSESIKREIVAELYAKIQSLGAHKGILISTSGFQSGATLYAEKHGIALWQICDRRIKHIYNCVTTATNFSDRIIYEMLIDKLLPAHFMMEWNCQSDYPETEIYPTATMQRQAAEKARTILKNSKG